MAMLTHGDARSLTVNQLCRGGTGRRLVLLAFVFRLLHLVRRRGLGAAGDGDLGFLVELGAVLAREFGGHQKRLGDALFDVAQRVRRASVLADRDALLDRHELRGGAQVDVRREGRVLALRQRELDVSKGVSGGVLNVVEVMPFFEMNVDPTRSMVTP